MANRVKQRKRARKGSGTSFWSDARDCWLARKTLKGKRYEGYGATEEEAIAARDAKIPLAPLSRVTLAAWSARWLESLGHKPQTIDSYRDTMRTHILPRLGTCAVAQITAFDVEECVKKWGQTSAAGTVGKILTCLSACLQAARRAKLVNENVAHQVSRPKAPKVKFDLFTREELSRIIEAGLSRRTWRCFALCAATGCRIGEATALSPGDYDARTGLLTISKTLTRRNGITSAKSDASHRTIEVPIQARPAVLAGIRNASYSAVYTCWRRLLRSLGLRYRGIHQLKHSVASIMAAECGVEGGVSLADAAAFLGDTFAVFVETYAHPVGGNPAGIMQRALGGLPDVAKKRA